MAHISGWATLHFFAEYPCIACPRPIIATDPALRLCQDCRLEAMESDARRFAEALGLPWIVSVEHDPGEWFELLRRVEGCPCCCGMCRAAELCPCKHLAALRSMQPDCYCGRSLESVAAKIQKLVRDGLTPKQKAQARRKKRR